MARKLSATKRIKKGNIISFIPVGRKTRMKGEFSGYYKEKNKKIPIVMSLKDLKTFKAKKTSIYKLKDQSKSLY
jgi:hypothetical protein